MAANNTASQTLKQSEVERWHQESYGHRLDRAVSASHVVRHSRIRLTRSSNHEGSMKKLAAAFQGKTAKMMRPADAERLTGYHVGR
jgi:hypothetical protein